MHHGSGCPCYHTLCSPLLPRQDSPATIISRVPPLQSETHQERTRSRLPPSLSTPYHWPREVAPRKATSFRISVSRLNIFRPTVTYSDLLILRAMTNHENTFPSNDIHHAVRSQTQPATGLNPGLLKPLCRQKCVGTAWMQRSGSQALREGARHYLCA